MHAAGETNGHAAQESEARGRRDEARPAIANRLTIRAKQDEKQSGLDN